LIKDNTSLWLCHS